MQDATAHSTSLWSTGMQDAPGLDATVVSAQLRRVQRSSTELQRRAPTRVGVDASNLGENRTGVGNYVATLLEQMCEQHPEVEFYLYSNDEISFTDRPNVHLRTSRPKMRGPLWQNLQLPWALQRDRIDVFWGSNGLIPLVGPRRVARVVTIHDLAHRFAPESQESLVRWNRRIFQRIGSWAAQRVVTVSAATARDVQAHYGRDVHEVIHPVISDRFGPVEPAAVAAVVDKFELPERFLLSVSTLEPRKNIANLIRAVVECRDAGLDVPLLVLAGGKGWLDSEIAQTAARAEEMGYVKRLGFVPNEDLPGLYAACEAFVLPSIYEGFGMPVLEAQVCGAPVIHGDHASMAEAAGGVGVAVGRSVSEIKALLIALVEGDCPLACRVPTSVDNDASKSAARLWETIEAAYAEVQAEAPAPAEPRRGWAARMLARASGMRPRRALPATS